MLLRKEEISVTTGPLLAFDSETRDQNKLKYSETAHNYKFYLIWKIDKDWFSR